MSGSRVTSKFGCKGRERILLAQSETSVARLCLDHVGPVRDGGAETLVVHWNVERGCHRIIRHVGLGLEVQEFVFIQLWLGEVESRVAQQGNRVRESQGFVVFEFVPVDTVKAGKVTVVAGISTALMLVMDNGMLLDAFFAVVEISTARLVEFLVLLHTVVTVVDAVLAVHWTRGVVERFIVLVWGVWPPGEVVGWRVVGDAATQGARRSQRRRFVFAAASEFVRLRRESRGTPGRRLSSYRGPVVLSPVGEPRFCRKDVQWVDIRLMVEIRGRQALRRCSAHSGA